MLKSFNNLNQIKLKNSRLASLNILNKRNESTAPGELHSYTEKLYQENYIKYPVQSKVAVTHDYVFHGDERLPTLEQRLKEFKDPRNEFRRNVGATNPNAIQIQKSLRQQLKQKVEQNKTNNDLEIAAKEAKRKLN
jgi:hypothetical protein